MKRFLLPSAAAMATIMAALACGSASNQSNVSMATKYEKGWQDGLLAGYCDLVEQDNCVLYYRPPELQLSDWASDEYREIAAAYQAGYNDGASRVWDCAAENGVTSWHPDLRASLINLHRDEYQQCTNQPHGTEGTR